MGLPGGGEVAGEWKRGRVKQRINLQKSIPCFNINKMKIY